MEGTQIPPVKVVGFEVNNREETTPDASLSVSETSGEDLPCEGIKEDRPHPAASAAVIEGREHLQQQQLQQQQQQQASVDGGEGVDLKRQGGGSQLGHSHVEEELTLMLPEVALTVSTAHIVEDGTPSNAEPDSGLMRKSRTPVMIMPLTDKMTMSPVRGRPGKNLDDILQDQGAEVGVESSNVVGKEIKTLAERIDGESQQDKQPMTTQSPTTTPNNNYPNNTPSTFSNAFSSSTTANPALAFKRVGTKGTDANPKGVASNFVGKNDAGAAGGNRSPAKPRKQSKVHTPTPLAEGASEQSKLERKEEYMKKVQPKKPKLTKAERRELQERQRATKAALKGETTSGQKAKQDKGPPKPQSQYDNEKKLQKQKRKSIIPRTTTEKSVELFSHLPQFDKQPVEESFQKIIVSGLHPQVVKLGKSYSTNSISGANARCLAMLSTFKLVIQEYTTPPGRTLVRDLTSHLNMIIQFLIDCRPLGVSMGNAIRYLKTKMGGIHPSTPDTEAQEYLIDTIDSFIQDKILDASSTIAETASTKIEDGNIILTYAFSHSVYQTFKLSHKRGIKFRVVVADCRPHFEGRKLMSRLIKLGIDCTYLHIASLSYIMPQVNTVFLGAASALANGTVISRVGTAVVAMVASEFGVPVAVCCETYKFHERVQLDSITFNELGNPQALVDVRNRPEVQGLQEWDRMPNLRLLNLMYDAVTEKYISMVITEVGIVPASSVPVILRESCHGEV